MTTPTNHQNPSGAQPNPNLPEAKFRAGAISATIWKNSSMSKNGQPIEFRTVSLERVYKDKDDHWQSTHSFRLSDLPKAAIVLNKAYESIVLKDQEGATI